MMTLCLHHVSTSTRGGAKYRQFLITPKGLTRVIRSARALGMEFISMAEVLKDPQAFWQTNHANKIVMTYDDGYENFFTDALPVLEREACPATVFVVAGKFAGHNDWDPDMPHSPLMSLEQMQQATRSGLITIGSHGLLHRRLQTLTPDELDKEIDQSHQILAASLGSGYLPVLAYPYGNYSQAVVERAKNSPFKYSFTIKRGHWLASSLPHEVPRFCVGIKDNYPLVFFAKCLRNRLLSALGLGPTG
ncbi:MAG: polysaccharide deacetylase family protein [Verrucomicrobiota bacterium]